MKKFLEIIGAMTLRVSASTSVVGCFSKKRLSGWIKGSW